MFRKKKLFIYINKETEERGMEESNMKKKRKKEWKE